MQIARRTHFRAGNTKPSRRKRKARPEWASCATCASFCASSADTHTVASHLAALVHHTRQPAHRLQLTDAVDDVRRAQAKLGGQLLQGHALARLRYTMGDKNRRRRDCEPKRAQSVSSAGVPRK